MVTKKIKIMATKKEKQLAIAILKERLEHLTGKKVVLKENINSTEVTNPEEGYEEGVKVTVTFEIDKTAELLWGTKNLADCIHEALSLIIFEESVEANEWLMSNVLNLEN